MLTERSYVGSLFSVLYCWKLKLEVHYSVNSKKKKIRCVYLKYIYTVRYTRIFTYENFIEQCILYCYEKAIHVHENVALAHNAGFYRMLSSHCPFFKSNNLKTWFRDIRYNNTTLYMNFRIGQKAKVIILVKLIQLTIAVWYSTCMKNTSKMLGTFIFLQKTGQLEIQRNIYSVECIW